MKLFVLVAAAAMTLASCQKNEIDGPVKQEVHFTIKADFAETKTAIEDNGDKTYTPTWAKGDKIGVLFSLEESAEPVDFENTVPAGKEATFEGKHAFAVVEGASEVDGNLYAFYPSSAFNKMYSDGGVRLDLENIQYPTSTSFDPSCDLLIAKPCYYVAEATGADVEVLIEDMYFARMMSVLRINLNSNFLSNETVKSISFDADGVDFTGAMKFNLETGEFVGNQSTSQDLSEVKAVYSEEDPIAVAGDKNSAYIVVAPVTIPSGTPLTFTIETENYDIVKTLAAPADMVMPAGNIAVINLTIAEENCTIKTDDTSDYSGEWLITGVNEGQVYAAGAYVTSKNNLSVTVPITVSGENINEVDGLAACKMVITKITEGEYVGMYTIQDANELYLYAASSSSNQLKASTTLNENSYWEIAENTDGTYSVVATKSSNRNVMQFNYNNASPIFSCYASDSMSDVTLYPYSYVQPDTTPRIIVAEEALTQNVDADATGLSFNYSLKNISGVPTATVAEGATMTKVSATADNGTVTVTFAANEEESPKTATVTLSYEGAEPVSVTITQAAKAAAGAAYYEKVTSAPADWSGNYLIVFGSSAHATNADNKDLIATTSVSITDNKIAATDALAGAVMTVTKSGDNYHMTYPDGKYFGMAKNASTAVTSAFDLTFIYTDSGVKISGVVNGITYILYSNSGNYFRCYTDKTGTSGYTLPTLYKLSGNSEGEGGETPEPELQDRNLAFSSNTATATVGEDFTEPTLSGATTGVTYSSSNTSVATVNESTGEVTLVAAGETTITATAAADATYKAGEASYALTVSAGSQGGETSKTWKLVTDASTLTAGDKLAIVSSSKGKVAGSLTSQYLESIAVTITDNAFSTLPSGAVEFTLGGASGAWTLAGSDGKLLGATAVKKLAWGSGTTTWSISIDDNGDATIQNGTSSYGRFLYNNSSPRFTTYTSNANASMLLPQIYRYE